MGLNFIFKISFQKMIMGLFGFGVLYFIASFSSYIIQSETDQNEKDMNLYRRGRRFEKKNLGDWMETKEANVLGAK